MNITHTHIHMTRGAVSRYAALLAALLTCNGAEAGVKVHGNVYGGGNQADVKVNTTVNISTGEVQGSVYGGGKGLDNDADAAKVHGNTSVNISGGQVIKHVYGGGEMASVGDKDENADDSKKNETDDPLTTNPFPYSTGLARVTINGTAEVGTDENCLGEHATGGYVYGSGLGKAGSDYSERTFVKNAIVTIGGTAHVRGSVFGSGENGHVRHDTRVLIQGDCKIGTELTIYDEIDQDGKKTGKTIDEHEVDDDGQGVVIYRGNVYGGGRGVDHTAGSDTHYSLSAGRVYGNTLVEITGGNIYHDVFGGGSLATVGTATYDSDNNITAYTDGTGKATVNISGGIIGYSANNDTNRGRNCGFVYGGCRGLAGQLTDDAVHMAYVHDTEVNIREGATIRGSVFGGGANGHVAFDTKVNISGGEIGEPLTDEEATFDAHGIASTVIFRGNVYVGGRGVDHYGSGDQDLSLTAGRVYGNAELNMTGGHVWHNVYGAGSMASVGTVTRDSEGNIDFLNGTWTEGTGHVKITISGGIVGDDTLTGDDIADGVTAAKDHPGRNNGRVYGGGRGVSASRSSRMAGMQYVYDTEVNISGSAYIYGAVFGGGENGHVRHDTHVNISGGTIGWPLTAAECHYNEDGTATNPWRGHVYGGGRGVDPVFHNYDNVQSFTAGRVYGNTNVTMTGGLVRRAVYGGGLLASVGSFTMEDALKPEVNEDEDDIEAWPFDETLDEDGKPKNKNGVATITIDGGIIGNLNADGTLIEGAGRPGYNNGHVYGSGCGMVADHESHDEQYAQMGYVYRSVVNISQSEGKTTIIRGSVFGSGENGHVWEDTHVIVNGGTIGHERDNSANSTDTDQHRFLGNVYGSGRGVDHTADSGELTHISRTAGKVSGNTNIEINGGVIWNDVYGGGSMASVGNPDEKTATTSAGADEFGYLTGLAKVKVQGTSVVHGSVYGSGRGIASTNADYQQAAFIKNSDVQILGSAHIYNNVYGGGNAGHVRKNTKVIIGSATGEQQPTIDGSVYGGGAGSAVSASAGVVYHNVEVNLLGGTVKKNVYGGGAIANTNLHDERNDSTDNEDCKEVCTTVVNLTGGLIEGDAYGGGEGLWNTANGDANVFGDISVTLNGTAFNISYQDTDEENVQVVKSGRVFGANNLNGSPRGNVTVTVEQTVEGNTPRTAAEDSEAETLRASRSADVAHTYEVAAVYGGGNLSPFTTAGRTASVIINNCDVSIREVYGGGNAAAVPGASVTVNGAWEIETVFGGGNGKDKYSVDGGTTWTENPGANVNGSATTLLNGGYIHEAYGGSNKKGTITGTVSITAGSNASCPLDVGKIVGAGREADISGDVKLVMGCMPAGTKIPVVFAGANNANVYGNVELTVTSGDFGQVFAGNNEGGNIYGHIKLNVEETSCIPLTIDELYTCGNLAAYSVYGYDDTDGHPLTEAEYNALTEAPSRYADPEMNIISCTRIGQVFGGGYGATAKVYGNPTVNINMIPGDHAAKIDRDGDGSADNNANALGAIGDVFGGGNAADVYGNTTVNICTAEKVQMTSAKNAETGELLATQPEYDVTGAFITGNVYGGGNEADVTGNATVNVSGDDPTDLASVTRKAVILGSVYGGGNLGSVGTVSARADLPSGHSHGEGETCLEGKPTAFATNTGKCTVTVNGWAEIGPDNMQMKAEGGPDDTGYVFGASRGEVKDPSVDADIDFRTYVYETDVTIGGHAFIKGSVYGGSENGRVFGDTDVKIKEHCQIGNGWDPTLNSGAGGGVNARYDEDDFINPSTATAEQIEAKADILHECASWDYGKDTNGDGKNNDFTPYDKHSAAGGGATTATDGHTFYGNVFGGGSGLFPYLKKGTTDKYEWLRTAGRVEGNTNVTITGGHILTSVYGGCELTDVGNGLSVEQNKGKCTVKMSGGTLGVPRTLAQIAAHPVTCYLFGAGKGDQRRHFNQWTNVGNVEVEVSGSAIIYGSVFGGGEDGHVLGDVRLTVKDGSTTTGEDDDAVTTTTSPVIGTWGTSYVDGNVFGGGRGFGGDALTAGVVSGNVDIDIQGGTMLGSIYGGGRLASVGTYLVPTTVTDKYGSFIEDGTQQTINEVTIGNGTADVSTASGVTHGHVTISISGGTIGNDLEYKFLTSSVATSGKTDEQIATDRAAELGSLKAAHHIPNTDFDYDSDRGYYMLKHTKGGNVFAGSMGRFFGLDGSTVLPHWVELGKVKSTKLTITGGTIKSCVYGGGELGWTSGTHKTADDKDVSTEISIEGGTIGSVIEEAVTSGGSTVNAARYTFGSVFGGGYGSAIEQMTDADDNKTYPKFQAGRVTHSTVVGMSSGTVLASVYGGGELASVGYGFYSYKNSDNIDETPLSTASEAANTYVTVSGGTVGKAPAGGVYFGGATMGNIYGGGSGSLTIVRCGLILGNTNVSISGNDTHIYHNVYGGGAYGSVGNYKYHTLEQEYTDPATGETVTTHKVEGVEELATAGTGTATVTITGGTIGYDGKDNGMVFGSSRGDVQGEDTREDFMAWVNDACVTIGTAGSSSGPQVCGSVYGSGENGHTLHNTAVNICGGTVGIDDSNATGYTVVSNGTTYHGAEYPSRGNVYGGGCGTDTYTKAGKQYYNPMAGIVRGNATVTMSGGHVVRSLYGGGSMGSVGTFTNDATGKPASCIEATEATGDTPATEGTGLCTVTVSGGKVGPSAMAMPYSYGHVFGGGRGETHDPSQYPNLETSAYFNRTLVTVSGTAFVKGSVYGGSESGHVLADTHVVIDGNCQIGCGKNTTAPYGSDVWADSYVPSDDTDLECVSWPFTAPYTPYDKFADAEGKYPDGTSADNAHPEGTDGHTFYGNVFGGGSGFEPYAPGKWLPTAGWVEGNTLVEIKGGHILTSVYGGNEMSDVGKGGVRKMTDLENETADMFYDITQPGGKCTVKMSGGTLGVPRTLAQIAAHPVTCYLFGAGKGDQRIFFNKTTNVKEVEVEVSGTACIYGSVFGGGEDGHVMRDVSMTIKDNARIGTWGTSYVEGNIFGGGRGFSGEALTAGNVGGSVTINIEGGRMLGSIYGGGRLGSVGHGLYLVDEMVGGVKPYGVLREDGVDDRGNAVSGFKRGYITINISGGIIGNDIEYKYNPTADDKLKMPTTQFDYQNRLTYTRGGNVFAGCMGRLYSLDNKLLPLWPELGRCKQTALNITGGTIKSNVYGGAELGVVQQNTTVSITGGIIGTKIGTGDDAYYYGSVFGGGKGSTDAITYPEGTAEENIVPISEAGTVHGNVLVELNKGVETTAKGGIVHQVFGCNDMNGSPKGDVTVHVYATQNADKDDVGTKYDKDTNHYDVAAVYGGGNMAAYLPTKALSGTDAEKAETHTRVIIDGCSLTSIETVYGGGNAASTPATCVDVYGTYEIDEVFGGGNGKDAMADGKPNPGANVGYKNYTVYEEQTDGSFVAKDADDADTKEKRLASTYVYGSGAANVNIHGGTVHRVYGGSNTKGNVRISAVTMLEDATGCEFNVEEAYGGGKSAPMDATSRLEMACIPGLKTAYGGAENAEIEGDVEMTITNGTFDRVFGGNNVSGYIKGKITVNIEETGCKPLIIGQLYGGGNLAPYTPATTEGIRDGITLNVRSFSSIGDIYGGGYGESAVVKGNTHVNINVAEGDWANRTYNYGTGVTDRNHYTGNRSITFMENGVERTIQVYLPPFQTGKIGAINNVFGGGNAAMVDGNTNVLIGQNQQEVFKTPATKTVTNDETGKEEEVDTTPAERTHLVKGADIRGNVYGGGNNAAVTGNTNVVIGKRKELQVEP